MKKILIIIFILGITLFAPMVRAETNNEAVNKQLIATLQQLITILLQQVEDLKVKLVAQQLIEKSPSTSTPQNIISTVGVGITKNNLDITSVNVIPSIDSARIEWQTNSPTESKVYITGGSYSSKVFPSEAGFTKNHFANIYLPESSMATYSYEITANGDNGFTHKNGNFQTLPHLIAHISTDKNVIRNDGVDYVTLTINVVTQEGQVFSNKAIQVNGQNLLTDGNGTALYSTLPTTIIPKPCDSNSIRISITEGLKEIGSINIPISDGKVTDPSPRYTCA